MSENWTVKKSSTSANHIVVHLATSGTGIEVFSPNFPTKVIMEPQGEHPKWKNYAVDIDTSKVEAGAVFTVTLSAIYWDGFQDLQQGDVSNYTDKKAETDRFDMAVLFPSSKPATSVQTSCELEDENVQVGINREIATDGSGLLFSKDHRSVVWQVPRQFLEPNRHFKISWKW